MATFPAQIDRSFPMRTHRFSTRIAASTLAALIAFSAIAHAQPAQRPEGPRYIKSERVNVRGGPGTGNSVIDVLLLGAEVQIYAVTGDWALISPPGKPEKWVYSPLLQPEKPQPKPQKMHPTPNKAQTKPEIAKSGLSQKDQSVAKAQSKPKQDKLSKDSKDEPPNPR